MRIPLAFGSMALLLLSTGCGPRVGEDGVIRGFTAAGPGTFGPEDFGVHYYPDFRQIHIVGNPDQPNTASARRIQTASPPLGTDLLIEVELVGIDPSDNSAKQLTERFRLQSQQLQSTIPSSGPNSPPQVILEIWFHGGDQNDLFTNDSGVASWANGSDGPDRLTGSTSRDKLLGGEGADVLLGRDGNDTLEGGHGSDALFGGRGDDFLRVIATGNVSDRNTLCGGAGADILDGSDLGDAESYLSDGDGAEFADILMDGTIYEYAAPPDEVRENGNVYDNMDDEGAPFSVIVDCAEPN